MRISRTGKEWASLILRVGERTRGIEFAEIGRKRQEWTHIVRVLMPHQLASRCSFAQTSMNLEPSQRHCSITGTNRKRSMLT